MKRIMVLLSVLLLGLGAQADSLRGQLRSTVQSRFGQRMGYFTLVPYKRTYFAAAYNVDSETRNSTGRKTHWAIYEYVNSRWSYIFEFDSTVDADEESARLDTLFGKYRFSSTMRGQLMYGNEERF